MIGEKKSFMAKGDVEDKKRSSQVGVFVYRDNLSRIKLVSDSRW